MILSAYGTSPRLWGKRPKAHIAITELRSTPTPVGKTTARNNRPDQFAVHPHACGENSNDILSVLGARGPPPRLWGKLPYAATASAKARSTPTPVGKTAENP